METQTQPELARPTREHYGQREHDLKLHFEHFGAVVSGAKKAEVRQHDRDYQVGDWLVLHEYYPEVDGYSGRRVTARVTHMTTGGIHSLPHGLCVLSIDIHAPVWP